LGKDTLNQTKAFTDAANTYDQRNSRGLNIIDEKRPRKYFDELFDIHQSVPLMFEVTIEDQPGELVPVFFDKANLDSSKAFVVDTGKIDGLFIWLGKDTLNQTKAFTDAANTYDQRNSRGLDIIDEKRPRRYFDELFDIQSDSGDGDSTTGKETKSGVPKVGAGCALVLAASSFYAV